MADATADAVGGAGVGAGAADGDYYDGDDGYYYEGDYGEEDGEGGYDVRTLFVAVIAYTHTATLPCTLCNHSHHLLLPLLPQDGYGDGNDDVDMDGDEDEEDNGPITRADAWTVIKAYFDEKGLVRQQLDSYDYFTNTSLHEIIQDTPIISIKPNLQYAPGVRRTEVWWRELPLGWCGGGVPNSPD